MLVVADTGVIISLIQINKLDILEKIFDDYCIAEAVWQELNKYDNPNFNKKELKKLQSKKRNIKSKNYLNLIMDYGESESVILYEELNAQYLLIDDKKARQIAESYGVNCIGTLAILLKAKEKNLITELKPIFEIFLSTDRYFSKNLLNSILEKVGESSII